LRIAINKSHGAIVFHPGANSCGLPIGSYHGQEMTNVSVKSAAIALTMVLSLID
jgi:hypothetical protein